VHEKRSRGPALAWKEVKCASTSSFKCFKLHSFLEKAFFECLARCKTCTISASWTTGLTGWQQFLDANNYQRRVTKRIIACNSKVEGFEGTLVAPEGSQFGVVVAKFNSLVTNLLLDGAMGGLAATGVKRSNIKVAYVPGSFELPVVAKAMAEMGLYDAIICIGAVVRGSTTHYEEVCSAATSGCINASTSTGVYSCCVLPHSCINRSGVQGTTSIVGPLLGSQPKASMVADD
jgi:6,7-dimethyl-8-ribityllumazine synthase